MQRTHSIVETLITYTAIIVLALGAATACSTDVRLGGRDSTEPSGDAGPASDSTASADSTTQPDALPSADSTPADDAAAHRVL